MPIVLKDNERSFEAKIAKATASVLNKAVRKNKKVVAEKLYRFIPNWVVSQPEIKSMLDEGVLDSLNAQLGLKPGQAVAFVDQLTEAIIKSTEIEITKFDSKFKGGIKFQFQPTHFRNLLSLSTTNLNLRKGVQVNWLEWLLTRGDAIIVVGYHYDPESGKGRSGGGTMEKGLVWRVPPQFSGTTDNNFITRLFSGRDKVMSGVLPLLLRV